MDINKEISFIIAGEAGQGIDSITKLVSEIAKTYGFNVFFTKEYMSRIKGGCNSSTIIISETRVSAYKSDADFVFALSQNSLEHLKIRLNQDTFIFYEYENDEMLKNFPNKIKINFSELSKAIGGNIYSDSIVLGIIYGILNILPDMLQEQLKTFFVKQADDVIEKNLQATIKGYEIGREISLDKNISVNIKKNESIKEDILINGNDAIALGCLAGGMDFISAYPMSPSTGILTFMAQNSKTFKIIAEQAEDEIAAINMGIGAWYAGSRAMVSTSGGGFALMCEAVSLAGMTETPIVIYLGQRPGPATGLPTRTEQGDLNLALYSGHGEFPRIILTPGNLEDAFYIAQKAFNLADKFQVPVFIMSDQYFADTAYNIKPFKLEHIIEEEFIQKTSETYKRYAFVQEGVSPRGIPNFGDGLIVLDSDEHDEQGHITEDFATRTKMVEKRMSKFDLIRKESIHPVYMGSENAGNLIVAWGSTCEIIKRALSKIQNSDIAFAYFRQVFPLNPNLTKYFENRKNIICIENNFSGQFANLLKTELNVNVNKRILKYNGLAFSVEELVSKINEVIK